MRGRAVLAFAALAAAACSEGSGLAVPEGVAAADPRLERCRDEATGAPEVRAIAHRQPAATQGEAWDRWREEFAATRRQIFLRCLAREGALAAGAGQRESGVGFGIEAPGARAPGTLPEPPRPAPSGY